MASRMYREAARLLGRGELDLTNPLMARLCMDATTCNTEERTDTHSYTRPDICDSRNYGDVSFFLADKGVRWLSLQACTRPLVGMMLFSSTTMTRYNLPVAWIAFGAPTMPGGGDFLVQVQGDGFLEMVCAQPEEQLPPTTPCIREHRVIDLEDMPCL